MTAVIRGIRDTVLIPAALLILISCGGSAHASDLIVSANDAKYVRVNGKDSYPEGAGPDTLTLIDASSPKLSRIASVEVHHSIVGPPQAVAITPDGKLAVVGAPNHYDRSIGKTVQETFLQLVSLAALPARTTDKIDIGSHPQGLSINRDGTLLLAATLDGTVAVLRIHDGAAELVDRLRLSDHRLSGVSFTHDGKNALVALRDDHYVRVLSIENGKVNVTQERVTTGVSPYSVDASGDGRWAVVSNIGVAGLSSSGQTAADADSVTLIDTSQHPFRAVQHLTVPSVPEGVAISPNGRWIAVQCMAGSNLPIGNPARMTPGRILLFEISGKAAHKVSDLPGGEAAQGIVFTADNRRILVQFNVEKQIAVYAIKAGKLRDTGERLPIPGGPASLRATPR